MRYRLPDRTETVDQTVWAVAWSNFADKVAARFPGYRVGGMDPGVMLFGPNNDTVSLSVQACKALLGE